PSMVGRSRVSIRYWSWRAFCECAEMSCHAQRKKVPMTVARPAVSVCVPAYQAATHLATAIRSVLSQNFADFELVVLDNASTDETSDIVRSFVDPRIRLVHNENTISMTANW